VYTFDWDLYDCRNQGHKKTIQPNTANVANYFFNAKTE
jgi:hypothetical protein